MFSQIPDPNVPAAHWLLLAVVIAVLIAGALLRWRQNRGLTKTQVRENNEAWQREYGPW